MKKSKSLSASPSGSETVWGLVWLAFQFVLLPPLLQWVNAQLSRPFSGSELNFCYYLVCFLAVFCIFHKYLGRSLAQVKNHPAYFLQAVVLGLAAYVACRALVGEGLRLFFPWFSNKNDAAIAKLAGSGYFLTMIGTVLLVPPVEECLFRGLIFRNLYGKSRWAAYLISMAVFAFIHLLGHLSAYSPLGLLLAFFQYLPAGLCLAWGYAKSDTIFAPMVIHAIINAMAIWAMR